jgi:hypothetical protein
MKSQLIHNCTTNNLECAESVRGSNLKLLAEHKTRVQKMDGVYQTPCHAQAYLKAGYILKEREDGHLHAKVR